MPDVIVSGRVVAIGDGRALVPATLAPDSRSDCAVTLAGENLPPLDCNASASGELIEQHLTVSEWSLGPGPHPTLQPLPDLAGVEPFITSRVLGSLPAEDEEIASIGETKLAGGQRTALVQLIRITPKVSAWLAEQPPGSVYVYPFIRDAGTPSVWAAGENHPS
jgi:hypothetical protein